MGISWPPKFAFALLTSRVQGTVPFRRLLGSKLELGEELHIGASVAARQVNRVDGLLVLDELVGEGRGLGRLDLRSGCH
jgi:hypothetical protein